MCVIKLFHIIMDKAYKTYNNTTQTAHTHSNTNKYPEEYVSHSNIIIINLM